MLLSVIVPVFNERPTIGEILRQVHETSLPEGISKEIIAVDDGSGDGTSEILAGIKDKDVSVVSYKENRGKTHAVREGLKHANGDIILIQDADLEYPPRFYPALLKPILEDNARVVYGSRFLGSIEGMAPINRISNRISNATINFFYKTHITDFHCGFKLFTRGVLTDIAIETEKFSFDTEITVKLLAKGFEITEVPIDYKARPRHEGKKITWGTALESYFYLVRYALGHPKKTG